MAAYTREKRRLRKVRKGSLVKRFGANETVSGAVAQRSGARLAALGGSDAVPGVSGADGYTGREARLIRNARARQKDERLEMSPPERPGELAPRMRSREEIERQIGDRFEGERRRVQVDPPFGGQGVLRSDPRQRARTRRRPRRNNRRAPY